MWPEDQAWCLACEVDEDIEFTVGHAVDTSQVLARALPGAAPDGALRATGTAVPQPRLARTSAHRGVREMPGPGGPSSRPRIGTAATSAGARPHRVHSRHRQRLGLVGVADDKQPRAAFGQTAS